MSVWYDNSSQIAGSGNLFPIADGANPLGSSFTTDAAGGIFSSLDIYLGDSPADLSIDLYGDNGGPGIGALVQNIAVVAGANTYPNFPGALTTYMFAPVTLAGLTRYWIVLTAQVDDESTWNYANNVLGTGVANEFASLAGFVSANDGGPGNQFSQIMTVQSGVIPPTVTTRTPILPGIYKALGWPSRGKRIYKGVKHG